MKAGEVIKLHSVTGASAQEVDETREAPFLPRFYFFCCTTFCVVMFQGSTWQTHACRLLRQRQSRLHPVAFAHIKSV